MNNAWKWAGGLAVVALASVAFVTVNNKRQALQRERDRLLAQVNGVELPNQVQQYTTEEQQVAISTIPWMAQQQPRTLPRVTASFR